MVGEVNMKEGKNMKNVQNGNDRMTQFVIHN